MEQQLTDIEDLARLISLLDSIEADDKLKTEGDFCLSEADHEYVDEIGSLADSLLISEGGQLNHENIAFVRDVGYFGVFPVERDSFGWLIGGIQTSKGVITFG